MVKVNLSRPVSVPINGIKTDLKPGVHNFDEKTLSHWFVRGLIEDGVITLAEDRKPSFKVAPVIPAVRPVPVDVKPVEPIAVSEEETEAKVTKIKRKRA